MPSHYAQLSVEELDAEISQLEAAVDEIRARGLKLNMARGKPSPEQLGLSLPMLDVLDSSSDLTASDGTDCRNYGCLMGIPECRALFGDILGVPADQVFVGGESSLTVMYDTMSHAMTHGVCGGEPWLLQMARAKERGGSLKWLCFVPGYDRHFSITQSFGFELIAVPLGPDGPDMDAVERLVTDPSVKGMWCVPQFSNPSGVTYSDEVVDRIAALSPAAPDFRVFWDNAYCEHSLAADFSDDERVANVFKACERAGHPDLVYAFCSTSKITLPGSGVSALGTSPANLADLQKTLAVQMIGHDKINQLRHVRFLRDMDGLREHMRAQAAVLRPRFELVEKRLSEGLGELGIASWSHPRGGYFVSFDGPQGSAKAIVALADSCGVKLTGAGSTWPYGLDPHDANIRIAPSFPTLEELGAALDVFVTCVKLVSARLERSARTEA
ncbi:MAG: aminotransferase [Coriobacteriia bacterium]|nr:aminotransferase [Coriobacteriia bacterium]